MRSTSTTSLREVLAKDASQLAHLRDVLAILPELGPNFGDFLTLTFVIDANIIFDDIRYKHLNPDCAQTRLEELIASGVVVLHAPEWLIVEMESSVLPQLSDRYGYPFDAVLNTWNAYREKICFHEGYEVPDLPNGHLDLKDVPYVRLAEDIQASGILSKDKDIDTLGGERFCRDAIATTCFYARATTGTITLRLCGLTVTAVPILSLIALIKGLIALWKKSPPALQLIYLVALGLAAASPKVRARIKKSLEQMPGHIERVLPIVEECLQLHSELVHEAELNREKIVSVNGKTA
ncbi:hypothetical protein [Parvularcula marina]|uniref:hypothetical protein n=1 Tax=Parvularcula marina TaxID=2292771 RepID=UPI003515E6BB